MKPVRDAIAELQRDGITLLDGVSGSSVKCTASLAIIKADQVAVSRTFSCAT